MKVIMLLGSGELGKEFVISAKRMGHYVIACDSYRDAPAMQVADTFEVFDMLDARKLETMIDIYCPDIIVPEIEAIATEVLYGVEAFGTQVVPSARAVNLTMNRDAIRDRAHELGLKVAKFAYAESEQELVDACNKMASKKVVIKPVMSSSGKGQSVVECHFHCDTDPDIELQVRTAWHYACENMRGNRQRVIIEEFIDFDYEITLLTVKQKEGPTIFCQPIGHVQKNGDYQYSWQPEPFKTLVTIATAQAMAKTITDDLGGAGLFGVEFFVKGDVVYFSELSPRPHDTGMVTMTSQNISQFDLHLRAILGLPIPKIGIVCGFGASAVILAEKDTHTRPRYEGIEDALKTPGVEVRIFGKPYCRKNRRMGVVLANSVEEARKAASLIKVV